MTQIAFSWHGLPQYAARLLRAAVDCIGEKCDVIGSPPDVPVRGMEAALGQKIYWVDARKSVQWESLGLATPKIFIQSGWSYPAFNTLGAQVKAKGGYVIGLSDANWRGDFRQLILGPLAFRALYGRNFDAMLVPGRQGLRLMRWFGMSPDRVRSGMYGADPHLFETRDDLALRPQTFLYVGQFIERKQVLALARAFQRFSQSNPGWTLHLCGNGALRNCIPEHPAIFISDFVQPEQLPELYSSARFFVLPSATEAWGLVVHEAALSGCALILSDKIGSADDLATGKNAIRFKAGSEESLLAALDLAARRDAPWLTQAGEESRRLAAQFGPDRFAREVTQLIRTLPL